jgi:hypothetical protein
MARRYGVTFEKVSVTAVQDLFQIIGATGKILRIIEVSLSDVDSTLPTAQMMALRCRFLPATVTAGSGGSSPTPEPFDPGDSAASFTAKANSTTKATTSATAVVLREDGAHLYAGYSYPFPSPPIIGPSESFVFELITAPSASGTWVMSGTVTVEETGG